MTAFPSLTSPDLVDAILTHSTRTIAHKGDVLVRRGQFMNRLPLILSGSVRVFQQTEDREVLMYYVQAGETCTMSLSACFFNTPSPSQAEAEETTEVLWIPTQFVTPWQRQFEAWNLFVIRTFHSRYNELLDVFNNVVFKNIQDRLRAYLVDYTAKHHTALVPITHQEMANELGTTRVVVSRILKLMEENHEVCLLRGGIEFKK